MHLPSLFAAAALLGVGLGFALRPWVQRRARAAQWRRWAPAGLVGLAGADPRWVIAAAEQGGHRWLVQRVDRATPDPWMPPRTDVLVDAERPADGWGAAARVARPGEPRWERADDAQRARLDRLWTPAVDAVAAARLGGRLAVYAPATEPVPGSIAAALRARWPRGWDGLVLHTWLDRDAGPEQIVEAMDGLRAVLAALGPVNDAAG